MVPADGSSFTTLAGALQTGVAQGVEQAAAKAAERLAQTQERDVAHRLADPIVATLLTTFDRRVRDSAGKVRAALACGDRRRAKRYAADVERAYKNGATVRAAVYSPDL